MPESVCQCRAKVLHELMLNDAHRALSYREGWAPPKKRLGLLGRWEQYQEFPQQREFLVF
jgi:hypothetical protein